MRYLGCGGVEAETSDTVAETSESRSGIWGRSISGRGNSRETTGAKVQWVREKEAGDVMREGRGGREAGHIGLLSPRGLRFLHWGISLTFDQDLACLVEEFELFFIPGESHWSIISNDNHLWIGEKDRLEARRTLKRIPRSQRKQND